jgi:hypothetical protein
MYSVARGSIFSYFLTAGLILPVRYFFADTVMPRSKMKAFASRQLTGSYTVGGAYLPYFATMAAKRKPKLGRAALARSIWLARCLLNLSAQSRTDRFSDSAAHARRWSLPKLAPGKNRDQQPRSKPGQQEASSPSNLFCDRSKRDLSLHITIKFETKLAGQRTPFANRGGSEIIYSRHEDISVPSNPGFHRPEAAPICSKCGVQMWLVHIQSLDQPNHNLRTFGCPKCDAVLTKVVTAGSKRVRTRRRAGRRN